MNEVAKLLPIKARDNLPDDFLKPFILFLYPIDETVGYIVDLL